ncbi:MAG: hypothetical protein V1776_03530 [Candidatus Diapherotrites archaeon]
MRVLIGLLILSIFFMSGCLSLGDSKSVARELRGERSTYVTEGLLAPVSLTDQQKYENVLLSYRKRIREGGGLESGILDDYVSGSLLLITLQQNLNNGNTALLEAEAESHICGKGTRMDMALASYQSAKENAQQARTYFSRVLSSVEIANELGIDFLENALSTLEGGQTAYEQRAYDIKTACSI